MRIAGGATWYLVDTASPKLQHEASIDKQQDGQERTMVSHRPTREENQCEGSAILALFAAMLFL